MKLLGKTSSLVQGGSYVILCFGSLVGKNLICFKVNQNFHSELYFSMYLLCYLVKEFRLGTGTLGSD